MIYNSFGKKSIAIGGVIPFAVIFVDLDELLKTITQGELYLSAQYIVTAWLLLAIATASVTIVLVFLQLCNEVRKNWDDVFLLGRSLNCLLLPRITTGGGCPLRLELPHRSTCSCELTYQLILFV